ncbi:metallophosphoesterase [Solirubrum puertoriconensis]|uniref:DNA mismatch repair protein MutT n=1 Tax=Solirubrum puertoriconensis TaxID=1751427 RepID=A0A9X0L654_SOLP1|nr:metallophosphoesterase [Solirubrum puertoriconensis]KUG09411.1 DNA mismatch repair protein MutT [Solirubrum puertoriconensis]
MSRLFSSFFFLALLVVAEWYGSQAIRTLLQHYSLNTRRVVTAAYWLVTVGLWVAGIWAMSTRHMGGSAVKSYIGGLLLAFVVAKLIVLLFLVPEDVVRLGRWVARLFTRSGDGAVASGAPITRSEFLSKMALLTAGIPFVALIYGMVKGATDYRIKRVTLRFPNLPASFDGFKMVQISDLHTGSFQSKEPLRRAVELINQQGADLVVMTGDLVNNFAHEVEEHIETLAGITSGGAKLSVLGNHDYSDYVDWGPLGGAEAKAANLARIKQNHAKIGWRLLLDETHHIERNGEKIAILGVQNWGQRGFAKYGDLPKTYASAGDAPFKILLSHDPSHWEAQVLEYNDIDLTLSGHTHGMQFGVNLPHLKWSPVQYVYRQWAGLYERGKQLLYVNTGLGFIGYPGRVGFLPEITVFELRRA